MAGGTDEFEETIENLKINVRKSFACMYATLKARELKTIRQLDAIRKQCQDNEDLQKNCVQNITVAYDNESTLLENINKYGNIDLEKLSFDNNTFILEDYISPNDDHMYLYKTIDELTKDEDLKELKAIEEAALRQIIDTEDCVCYVNVQSDEVSKKFREVKPVVPESPCSSIELPSSSNENTLNETEDLKCFESEVENDKCECIEVEPKKIHPTDDWLNSIKSQTETEPSQVTDVMEHSTIACS